MPKLSEKKKLGIKMLQDGVPVPDVAAKLKVGNACVYKWIKGFKKQAKKSFGAAQAMQVVPLTVQGVQDQLREKPPREALLPLFSEKLPERVVQLDAAAARGSVPAILAWFKIQKELETEFDPNRSDEPVVPTFKVDLTVKQKKDYIEADIIPPDEPKQLEEKKLDPLEFMDVPSLVPVEASKDHAADSSSVAPDAPAAP